MFDYEKMKIEDVLNELISELKVFGYRERTLFDYDYHFMKMCNGLTYVSEITRTTVIDYLSQEGIQDSTRRIRLKTVRAVLNKLYERDYIKYKFWDGINVKVDEEVKQMMRVEDIQKLYNILNHNIYTEFRDITAILTIYETGVRISTLSQITFDMVDRKNLLIHYKGGIMKNHKALSLPITQKLYDMLERLNRWNKFPDPLFQTMKNGNFQKAFSKRTVLYRERYGIEILKPHAIRRTFAKKLLDSGVNIGIISKALNHSDLSSTAKYLDISNREVIEQLRNLKDI